ncbi:TBC1 domain member 31 [Phlyctochytrium planicorne]|nr:TBC1 domain member 31 [Phlyctochytrium planicorne]
MAMSKEMVSASGQNAETKVSIDHSYSVVLAAVDQRGHVFALDFPKNSLLPSSLHIIERSHMEYLFTHIKHWPSQQVELNAVFTPDGDSVVTAFNDGTILIWDSDSFSVRWKVTIERFAANLMDSPDETTRLMTMPRTNYVAISYDGELMAYGGLLLREILIPSFKDRIISQVEFIGNTDTAAVLSSAGQLIFVDAAEAQLIGQFKGKHLFRSFSISPDGKVITLILLNAKYSIRMLRIDNILNPSKAETELSEPEMVANYHNFMMLMYSSMLLRPKKKNEDSTLLNRRKLRKFLKYYGSYPEKYRLPENRDSYEALLGKGLHPSFADFRKKYPMKSERVLSALAHWSPIFENLDYLPSLVFPFVKLFLNDMFSGFETVMTILINWCQKWWNYFPNPPFECLDVLENLLYHHDSELLSHFVKHKVTSQIYGWFSMSTLFAEIFSETDWLKVWDHLVTNPPSFVYYFVLAYLRKYRIALLATTDLRDFRYFFHRRNPVSVDAILLEAYRLHDITPQKISPTSFFKSFEPVLVGQYPIFNKFPEFIVNYQSKMKERIREEEEDYLRKRKLADEVNRLTEELRRDKKEWEKADWKMNEMVEKWWDSMMNMEESHTERKARLDAMEKEQRARALRRIAEARKSFVDHQYSTTKLRANALARAVGVNARDVEMKSDEDLLDSRFREIEAEWLARREEMISARDELARLDKSRLEKLVSNAKRVGVPRDIGNFKEVAETGNLRTRTPRSRSPARYPGERIRSWSPEMVAERGFRKPEQAGDSPLHGELT